MQTAANINCFFTGYSSKAGFADSEIIISHSRSIQYLAVSRLARTVYSKDALLKLTNSLIHVAERAYILRDLDLLQETSQILMSTPVDAARQIGSYYHALAMNRRGQRDEAEVLFETVADAAPIVYRARAIQALAANRRDEGKLNEALRFQLEAQRVALDSQHPDFQTNLLALLEIANIKGLKGDHKGAILGFESLRPLAISVAKQQPFYFYALHNDLAIDLGEAGCLDEARAASDVALASPYASAYPNWTETRQQLEAKRTSATPSVVAVKQPAEVIPAPQAKPQPCLIHSQRSSVCERIFAFCYLISRGTFHVSLLTIARFSAIANAPTNCNTLDRLGRCIKSRAPPTTCLKFTN